MYVIKSSLFNNHYFPVVRARRVIKSPFKLKGRTRSCVDNDGGFSFPFPNSQVSLFSTLEGEIRLVIPLQEKTSAHFGHLRPFNSVWTFQNNTLCIAKAGEGGPPLDDPVCPAPRVVALSAAAPTPKHIPGTPENGSFTKRGRLAECRGRRRGWSKNPGENLFFPRIKKTKNKKTKVKVT